MIRIDGTGISLRKFESRDVEALFSFRNDRDITSQLGGFSTGYSRVDLENWINYHGSRSDEVIYALVDETDMAFGHVGLYQLDHRVRKAEFAVLIGQTSFQGRGLGRSISSWMIDFGFSELNLNKITLSVLQSNIRAHTLYKSLGFVQEGVLRQDQYRDGSYIDAILMSLLRDEWESFR
jgi:RimJ/RimL family protein N-acetyltransferase